MNFLQKTVLCIFGSGFLGSCFLLSSYISNKPIPEPTYQIEEPAANYFPKALAVVLKHEGGYIDDPVDKGGPTSWGISLRFLKDIKHDVDLDGDIDKDDIIALTRTHADDLYLKHFWLKNRYNLIANEKLAIKIMDMAVNMGASRSHKIVQASINEIVDEQLESDGILDDYVIEILNLIEPEPLLKEIRKEQAEFYLSLIKRNPEYIKYKNGWLNRAKY